MCGYAIIRPQWLRPNILILGFPKKIFFNTKSICYKSIKVEIFSSIRRNILSQTIVNLKHIRFLNYYIFYREYILIYFAKFTCCSHISIRSPMFHCSTIVWNTHQIQFWQFVWYTGVVFQKFEILWSFIADKFNLIQTVFVRIKCNT